MYGFGNPDHIFACLVGNIPSLPGTQLLVLEDQQKNRTTGRTEQQS